MKSLFYDDQLERNKDSPEFLDVARMYCFNELDFTDEDSEKLGRFLEDLPTGLNVSMEAPWGMQVYGMVKESDWLVWDAAFQEKAR